MGGKKKTAVQQPRVKGNSKPSSSDKAARFLVQQTGGFGIPLPNILDTKLRGISLNPSDLQAGECQGKLVGFVPILQDPDATGLDSHLLSILKRLEKRDSVTKQKALREFCDILKPTNECSGIILSTNSVVAVLPFWPRIYHRLSFDGDRKVRELAQITMHTLASRVGKDLVVCLKQIVPTWTFATIDPHESAASFASRGLSDTFPGKKLSDAYCLCAKQLLDMVETQLADLESEKCSGTGASLNHSKHSHCDSYSGPSGNMETSSYSVDFSSILRFLASFVSDLILLPPDHKQIIRLKALLSPKNIWTRVTQSLVTVKYSQNTSCLEPPFTTSSAVYIAMYKLCSVLCRNYSWCQWMKETDDGGILGEHICKMTVGCLGTNCGQSGNSSADQSVIISPPCELSAGVYSSLWDATLACLIGLSGKFVWSVIDWHRAFITRLGSLLSHSERNQTKQVYTHLLCLLNEFPLDYSNLKNSELEIVDRLFVEATLSGLQRSLGLPHVQNTDYADNNASHPNDPDTPVVIVTGILECARYLIDRLLTPIEDGGKEEALLAKKIYSKVIVRLLSDCLITCTRTDDSPRLMCDRPLICRQSYINVIFKQVAKFCNNLAQSNHPLKISMYDELKNTLFQWINESEHSMTSATNTGKVTRILIGRVDPLRFISLLDNLARSSSQKVNKTVIKNASFTMKKLVDDVDQCDEIFTVQTDWCIDLFRRIGDILLNAMTEKALERSSLRSFYILLLLCIYGHLPLKCFTVPSIIQEVFSSLLPNLPHEVHSICWSHPVIFGLAKSWALSTENIDSESTIPTDSSSCLIFTNDILPLLIQSLSSLKKTFNSAGLSPKLLSNRLSDTLCFWARVWFDKIRDIENTHNRGVIAYMNNLHSLITSSLHNISSYNDNSDNHYDAIIPIQLVETLSNCLQNRYENILLLDSGFDGIHATELRITGSLLIHLLQEVGNSDLFNSSRLNYLFFLLTKLLFYAYNLSAFMKITQTVNVSHSLKSMEDDQDSLHPSVVSDEQHDDHAQDDDDGDFVCSFNELTNRSEGVILNRLKYEEVSEWNEESFFNQLSNLIFTTTAHSEWITPSFFQFVASLYSSVCDKQHPSFPFIAQFSFLWLKYLIEHVKLVLEAVVTLYPLPKSNLASRHLISNYRLSPLPILPHLGKLVRLHHLGLMLRLHLYLVSCDDEMIVNQYLLCLGFIRVWISSFCEPWDLCTDFGWPSEQIDLNVRELNSQKKHHLEPALSAFEKVGSSLTKTLGSSWHDLTASYPLMRLLNLSSSKVLESITPLESSMYPLLHLTVNVLLLNRLRTIHSNLWPCDVKLAASCSDDGSQGFVWTERYLPFTTSQEINYSDKINFNKCIELYLPAGIIRRCLPRQDLLGKLKSFSLSLGECDISNPNDYHLKIHACITELISSLVNIRVAAPIYLTTFSTVMLEDYRTWLTNLADAVIEDNSLCLKSPEIFSACLSTMSYLECLLLLWQPWQWSMVESENSPVSVRLGLIHLSMRMRQLRPYLSLQQWDFILCLTVSWVCGSVQYLRELPKSGSEKTIRDIFAFRSFRMSSALGAIFVRRNSHLPLSDCIISQESSSSKRAIQSDNMDENDDIEIEDEEPTNEFYDEEEHAKQLSDLSCDNHDQSKDILNENFNIDLEEELEADSGQTELDGDNDLDDEEYMYSAFSRGLPLIPRRGETNESVRNDWENFFSANLYSTFLPVVLKTCVPQERRECQATLDTDVHIQALCAAFATCPANHLITTFTNQPALILEFLSNVQLNTSQSNIINQLFPSKNVSVHDFTSGFRASLDMACKLITSSPHQSGQLLGHILLNRLFGMRILQGKNKTSVSIANYLVRRIPASWISALYGVLPTSIEKYLYSELAADNWGRGDSSLSYLIDCSVSGWKLSCQSHQALLGYLLAWDSLLSLMTCAGAQTRAFLQSALLTTSAVMFDRFMLVIGLLLPPSGNLEEYTNTVCRLEPDERLLLLNSTSRMYLTAALTIFSSRRHYRRPTNLMIPLASGDDREWRDVFSPDDKLLQIPGHRIAHDISHFAVRLFRRFLSDAPGLIRAWHTQVTSLSTSSQNTTTPTSPLASHRPGRLRQLAGTIDKLVSKYFSSSLARDEVVLVQYRSYLRLLNKERNSSKNLFSFLKSTAEAGSVRIKGRPLSREIIAMYHVDDEHSMEMIVQLPDNYPLSPVTVNKGRSVGVGSQQWQAWLLQLSVFINNHNGSILDGIDLWQRNVRKKFDGVEECAICFSVIHHSNFSVPKMNCPTCRKLFHYACMRKWFTTSKNRACPLCRQLFNNPTGRLV
uniref:E3 ubiquitin-protein ligase listerin n=1 Tax=Trichobilharzia regenti TaxID=157069 RepID=A0AA85JAD9_TRIRE|nr:unnamed protein product [Trichobilharzia regenti]